MINPLKIANNLKWR